MANYRSDRLHYNLLSSRFNQTPNGEIPQHINVFSDRMGNLEHQVILNNPTSPKNLISQLIEGENGRSSCPHHHSRRDRIEVKGELVGILKLVKPPDQVKFGEQLFWLWSKLKERSLRDLDVFLEISPGNDQKAQTNLIRLVKQSTHANRYAQQQGSRLDVNASQLSEEALEAQRRLNSGAQSLLTALTILVYRRNDTELDLACNRLIELFTPAKLIREDKVCWKRFLETLPINNERLCGSTEVFVDPRTTQDTESIRSVLPLIRPRDIHQDGVEFICIEGGYPLYINLLEESWRAIISGKSGSGKTVMAFGHIKQALYRPDRAVVGLDMSNAGESTLKPITEILGLQGAFINLIDESFNILQPPDLRRLNKAERKRRSKIWLESRRNIIVALVMGTIEEPKFLKIVTSIVTLTLDLFMKDAEIIRRYNQALEQGWPSEAWQKMPVLEDFLFFCSREKLGLSDFGELQAQAIEQIVTSIRAKLVDPNIGECISRSSSVSPYARLQFFGLSGLTDPNNAYILSLVAQAACLNVSLEYEKSMTVIDECIALLAKKGFASLVGMQFSMGRKEGNSVLLIGQNIEAIANCPISSQIFRNTDILFTGKVSSDAHDFYHQRLGIPRNLIRQNSGDTYGINKSYGYSNWLVSIDDRHWDTCYYPANFEMAGLANSADEKKVRWQIMQKYPNTQRGRCEGLAEFASYFSQPKIRKNK